MSRGLVIGDIAALAERVLVNAAHLSEKMGKVGFPKDYGTLSVSRLGLDSGIATLIPLEAYGPDAPMALTDYGFGLTEEASPIEPTVPLDGKIPVSPAIGRIEVKKQLVTKRTTPLELPNKVTAPSRSAVPVGRGGVADKGKDEEFFRNLEVILQRSRAKIKEVKLLPSGATRITLEDLFGLKTARGREPVKVGGSHG